MRRPPQPQGRNKMPLYSYQCLNCGQKEEMVGGVDDYLAHCLCGALMLRTDQDPFKPYFNQQEESLGFQQAP